MQRRVGGFTLIELMIVIAIIAIIAAIAIPNLLEARKHGNEAAAVGALKTISTCQALYREGDKDNNNQFDYGNLTQLSTFDLVDDVLGSGSKQGYLFACASSTSTAEFLWWGTANPVIPGTTGDRYFCTNQAGVVFYTTVGEYIPGTYGPALDTCLIAANEALPVGK